MTLPYESPNTERASIDTDDELWEARPIRLSQDGHAGIVSAIGRLAISSAGGEAILRSAIYETYLFGDNAILITEGESTSWLLDKLRFIVDQEFDRDPGAREACSRAKGLFAARNRFIHSELGVTDSGTYVTFVSRRHKELQPSRCTVDEIIELAKALEDACWDVHAAIRSARQSRL